MSRIYLTKKQVSQHFAASYQNILSRKDIPAIRQAWNDFVDYYQKSGQISERQAETWVNPFLNKNDR